MKYFIFFILSMLAVMTILPAVGLAAGYSYTITTNLPGVENIVAGNSASGITIAGYVAAIYKGALALVGFVAFIAIVYWGFVYTFSAGNTSKTGEATKGITQAILGLVLLLAGYLILNFVNPALVNIQQTDTSLSNIKSIDKPDKSGETPGGYTGGAVIGGRVCGSIDCAPGYACASPGNCQPIHGQRCGSIDCAPGYTCISPGKCQKK